MDPSPLFQSTPVENTLNLYLIFLFPLYSYHRVLWDVDQIFVLEGVGVLGLWGVERKVCVL